MEGDNDMEHERGTIHEASISTSAYCSVAEDLGATSSSECISTSSRYWTTVDLGSDSDDKDDEDFVCVLPGANVRKFETKDIKLLEKIGEGGQAIIYAMELTSTPDFEHQQMGLLAAKMYRGRRFGKWPEALFNLTKSSFYICRFYGYCLEGESFYLVMEKYDCSLRDRLDKKMKQAKFKGRPLSDFEALVMIVQVAVGMWYLHENNIVHRDLKADNVFVRAGLAHIGDFDVALNVVGTLFWRAPEVLQALKEDKDPVFTPKADVYSFAMTCYEILTGGVPLDEERPSNYDAVLLCKKRPKLPSNLNPKVKNLITRCWDHDPEARPTFKEIVLELKRAHGELIFGSKAVSHAFDRIFYAGRSMLDPPPASPEACLVKLKLLLVELLVKYNHADFLVVCMEVVAGIEEYQCKFGLGSCKEHPLLPFPEWFARKKMCDSIIWRYHIFDRSQAYIFEAGKISILMLAPMEVIFDVSKNHSFLIYDQSQISAIKAFMTDYNEEFRALVLPDYQHKACFENLAQACDLCIEPEPRVHDLEKAISCLYVDSGFTFPEFISGFFSSLGARIGTLM